MLPRLVHVFLFLIPYNVASALQQGVYCYLGCELSLGSVDFNDTARTLPKKVRDCTSLRHVTSLYLCADAYCGPSGRETWLKEQGDLCANFNQTLPGWDVIDHYGDDDKKRIRRLTAEEGIWSANTVLDEVVIPEESFFLRCFRTWDTAMYENRLHWLYGFCMYYFWLVVVVIGLSTRLIHLIQHLRTQEWQPISSGEDDVERHSPARHHALLSSPYTLLKRYILVPATFGYRCSQNVGWCTVPPRIQSCTIFAFVLLNTILCVVNYQAFTGNMFWPRLSAQYFRYISDRTGIISLANFPLIWLFGTRNNVLLWVTGWGFGTYNNFHRWVARISTVQAVVHSLGYTKIIWTNGGWPYFEKYLYKHYFWNGELATIFMVAICVFSVYGLRRSHYEIFLIIHIAASVAVIWTMYYHVYIFKGEYDWFIWPCVIVWVLDRVIRMARILSFDSHFWNTKCIASYDFDSNLIRLDIPFGHSRALSNPQPGTYYYIYVLSNPLYMHQSHPFTLGYVRHPEDKSEMERPSRLQTRRASVHRSESESSTESDALLASDATSDQANPSLVFLVRPYDGFTARLKKSASSGPTELRVLVEGPYGETNPLSKFSSVLFVVGGTGIAVPLSYLAALLDSTSKSTRIHILWAVREHRFLTDVLKRDFRQIIQDRDAEDKVTLTVHVTQEDTDEGKDDDLGEGLKRCVLKAGRPDVYAAVEEEAQLEETNHGGLAVVACGPAQMADDARRATIQALERGHRGIEYFEESFKW
ncbi:hypothetical protein BU24DRAFT_379912 [Aaosphaeria arxii CBS 175.79]|uniref:FAD-binding FR-type domain-containing protein n=1 Tax=Aaosphaeria arxii CBS 175.79 TaxID=1450172 RepID=A0A6A5X9A2_9PLEO|nr:uncharacterized protein BU24DRAFT_379912 [Aaosphaeria arxii CBS 175.79]KAF2009490.1 hypothetical protein BU24DRAFT_379912 [Aaosphaeria arxii CBS 175.79]